MKRYELHVIEYNGDIYIRDNKWNSVIILKLIKESDRTEVLKEYKIKY